MKLRALILGPAIALGLAAFAQPVPPYDMTVAGYLFECTPGSSVNILTIQGTVPDLDIDVPVDANCQFSVVLPMESFQGWFQVSTTCNGAMQQEVLQYTVNALSPDSNEVYAFFNCGNSVVDCLNMPGGPALPGTACNTALGLPGTWSADCDCVPNNTDCEACFTVQQASTPANGPIPFMANFSNCSTGSDLNYSWSFDGGLTFETNVADSAVEFAVGTYQVCLLASNASCTVMSCDTLVVDENGTINPLNIEPCEAGFFVMQAYQWVDSAANPNGGGGEPIPNELWLWNLSNGGTGNFQFTWSWGDGTSSTMAFPSHTYSSSGTYNICLTIADNAGCTDTYCQDITVDGDGILDGLIGGGNRANFTINVVNPLSVGIPEQPTLTGLNAWPNPVNDVLNVSLDSRIQGNVRIAITDLSGRVVSTDTRSINDGRNNLTLAAHELNAGLYLITISTESTTLSKRFVKVH